MGRTRWPCRAKRTPRSASSVTLKESHPQSALPEDFGAEMIEVPPAGCGMQSRSPRPGRRKIEPRRIFEREHARQPIVFGVVDIEPRPGNMRPRAGQRNAATTFFNWSGSARPPHRRSRRSAPLHESRRIIAGARLRSQGGRGHVQDFEAPVEMQRLCRRERLAIVLLQNDLDIELGRRVIERLQRRRDAANQVVASR